MKAITKYPGSKWSIADWIINFFPEHHSYLEPFFGSGAVLFNKPRSHIETINDLDGNVVTSLSASRKTRNALPGIFILRHIPEKYMKRLSYRLSVFSG